jgi:hypothetical protein
MAATDMNFPKRRGRHTDLPARLRVKTLYFFDVSFTQTVAAEVQPLDELIFADCLKLLGQIIHQIFPSSTRLLEDVASQI